MVTTPETTLYSKSAISRTTSSSRCSTLTDEASASLLSAIRVTKAGVPKIIPKLSIAYLKAEPTEKKSTASQKKSITFKSAAPKNKTNRGESSGTTTSKSRVTGAVWKSSKQSGGKSKSVDKSSSSISTNRPTTQKQKRSRPTTDSTSTRKTPSKKGSVVTKKKAQKTKEKPKEKVKKLNRKVIYKNVKLVEKRILEEEKTRKKFQWEKNKILFYWNCAVSKLIDLNRINFNLKKKEESLNMLKKHGLFHEYWGKMNRTRLEREECLDAKREEFRMMIVELRDNQKKQTDCLFKDIQNYVNDTYRVGQNYISDVVGIRMEYTKRLTQTLFEARENARVLEIEQNAKYGPVLEAFEEEMRSLRRRIPIERQERLQKMLDESNAMLVELVNVYTNILHHNFIEVCHTANIINELKTKERRLQRENEEILKKRNNIKERSEYLHDRISNLRRQVNSGKEARKRLHRVMKDQEFLQHKKDIAYINKEMTFHENTKLQKALTEMSEKVDDWYFKVKRHFLKSIIVDGGIFKERVLQLDNYNRLVEKLFGVEKHFLETIEQFKDHEEFEDQNEGIKVILGSFKPHTIEDLELEFEGCTESFATAIIFFKRRLHQNYLTLDDLHFFIKRRNPLSYLGKVKEEEAGLMRQLNHFRQKRPSVYDKHATLSLQSFLL